MVWLELAAGLSDWVTVSDELEQLDSDPRLALIKLFLPTWWFPRWFRFPPTDGSCAASMIFTVGFRARFDGEMREVEEASVDILIDPCEVAVNNHHIISCIKANL